MEQKCCKIRIFSRENFTEIWGNKKAARSEYNMVFFPSIVLASQWFHSLGCKCKPIHEYVNIHTATGAQGWSLKVFKIDNRLKIFFN